MQLSPWLRMSVLHLTSLPTPSQTPLSPRPSLSQPLIASMSALRRTLHLLFLHQSLGRPPFLPLTAHGPYRRRRILLHLHLPLARLMTANSLLQSPRSPRSPQMCPFPLLPPVLSQFPPVLPLPTRSVFSWPPPVSRLPISSDCHEYMRMMET